MAIKLVDNFSYQGQKPLDVRIVKDTISDIVASNPNTIYDGIIVYCKADKKYYDYDSTRTSIAIYGKWRELTVAGEPIKDLYIDDNEKSSTYQHLIAILDSGKRIDCGKSVGEKGDKGDGFAIIKLYSTISDMTSDPNPVDEGMMVAVIKTDEEPVKALVYIRNPKQTKTDKGDEVGYTFFCDLADATTIQGPRGRDGKRGITPIITITTVPATLDKPEGKKVTFTLGDGNSDEYIGVINNTGIFRTAIPKINTVKIKEYSKTLATDDGAGNLKDGEDNVVGTIDYIAGIITFTALVAKEAEITYKYNPNTEYIVYNGVGIKTAEVRADDNHLIITKDDNTEVDAGDVLGDLRDDIILKSNQNKLYCIEVLTSGALASLVKTYTQYTTGMPSTAFISKGTLENVIEGKFPNKDALDKVTDEGEGDKFLADDGNYKEVIAKALPYVDLKQRGDYLYEIQFDSFPKVDESVYTKDGACSSYSKGNKVFRNLDYYYTNNTSFIVETPKFRGMAFLDGLENGKSRDWDLDKVAQLPNVIVDGMNKSGIVVTTHLIYNDDLYDGYEGNNGIPMKQIPSLILNTCTTPENVKNWATIYGGRITIPKHLKDNGQILIFFIKCGSEVYSLQPNTLHGVYALFDLSTQAIPKLTNFLSLGTDTIEKTTSGLQKRPNGLERYNLIHESTSLSLHDLRYTKTYESPDWLSEFIGMKDTTKDTSDLELRDIYNEVKPYYDSRTREAGLTWQTMHSVTYDTATYTMTIHVQEDWSKEYKVPEVVAGSGGGANEIARDESEVTDDTILIIGDTDSEDYPRASHSQYGVVRVSSEGHNALTVLNGVLDVKVSRDSDNDLVITPNGLKVSKGSSVPHASTTEYGIVKISGDYDNAIENTEDGLKVVVDHIEKGGAGNLVLANNGEYLPPFSFNRYHTSDWPVGWWTVGNERGTHIWRKVIDFSDITPTSPSGGTKYVYVPVADLYIDTLVNCYCIFKSGGYQRISTFASVNPSLPNTDLKSIIYCQYSIIGKRIEVYWNLDDAFTQKLLVIEYTTTY